MFLVPATGFSTFQTSQLNTANEGITVTAAATANVKGNYTTIVANTSSDWYGIFVFINNVGAASANHRMLVDIAIGPDSSEVVIIPDLLAGNAGRWSTENMGSSYFFPIFIPGGSRIAARCQSSTASRSCNVIVYGLSRPDNPSIWFGNRVTAYGIDLSASRGTVITPGSNSSYGSLAIITTATTNPIRYIQIGFDTGTDTTATNMRGLLILSMLPYFYIDRLPWSENTNIESLHNMPANWILSNMRLDVPPGSSITAQAMVSGTGEPRSIAVYGVD